MYKLTFLVNNTPNSILEEKVSIMKKSFIIMLCLVCVFIVSILCGYFVTTLKSNSEKNELVKIELAENNDVKKDIITTSSSEDVVSPNSENEEVDNNIKYILKEYNGCVAVYREENGNLVLEDVTDILTKYLSEEDLLELKKGIVVQGINELTHLIEDFE